uniref:Pleckstrin homology and RhoGEF domain containing G3 n=1 Tax=Anas zonorhyncha TaxID=75864 RepID=A0A8B9ZW86_9AVES
MPVPACPQRPALGEVPAAPTRGMEEEEEEEAACDGEEPWLANSNNNAAPGGRPGARGVRPPGQEPSYLQRVLLEIVESERTYARDLRGIVEGYLGKIIDAEEPPLRPEQVSALFGNIEDIYELSSNLLQSLESCACDPVAVAVCFVTRSQEFDIYTQYCNNYPNSVAALSECMRSKQQARFFRECQEQMRHALPLGAYLLKPVQRILKYHLLLQEIAKHFERKSGDDYEVVVEAIDTMTCVAWYINDMKRKHEHAIRQQEIQSLLLQWKGPDLTSYGELVLEGTFRVQRARSERAVFLFDKLLLITKRRGDHYVYKSHILCSSLMLIESTRDSLCFSVAHYKHIKQQYGLQVGCCGVWGGTGDPCPEPQNASGTSESQNASGAGEPQNASRAGAGGGWSTPCAPGERAAAPRRAAAHRGGGRRWCRGPPGGAGTWEPPRAPRYQGVPAGPPVQPAHQEPPPPRRPAARGQCHPCQHPRWDTLGSGGPRAPSPCHHPALTPLFFPPGLPKPPVSPGDSVTPTVSGAPRSPPSPGGGGTEPFSWPDVRELRARFGAPRPPPVTRSRSAPEGPGRGGRPAAKERGGGRSRSAEAGVGTPDPWRGAGGGGGHHHHHQQQPGGLWVTAQAPLGPGGQRVVVLERLPPPAATEPPAYVQIRSPTTREKICLKAVVERCKAYQASEEYRRRCPPGQGEPPEPPRHGLVRDLRQKFQTLDAAS